MKCQRHRLKNALTLGCKCRCDKQPELPVTPSKNDERPSLVRPEFSEFYYSLLIRGKALSQPCVNGILYITALDKLRLKYTLYNRLNSNGQLGQFHAQYDFVSEERYLMRFWFIVWLYSHSMQIYWF